MYSSHQSFRKAFFVAVVFLFSFGKSIFAQQKPIKRDSTSTTFSFKPLSLPDPNSIQSKYEYDPVRNRYVFNTKLGEYNVRYPLYLSPDEFFKLIQKEEVRKYFKSKTDALTGRGEDAEEKQKRLLPIFYVNSGFFETVFGSNEIEIIPQGSVEVDLGVLFNRIDNPSLSPQNQRNFSFDFDQRISLSLTGNIGTRLSVNANYDTESTFDFQNQLKLAYEPNEDAIVQALEIGNVNFPLNSSLIQGAQSLFGVKAQFQFGKTTITGVFSEQRSDTRRVQIQAGGTVEDYEINALDYDENRHFFLSHYFRDTYDNALASYPFINSNINVTRIQVWITNRSSTNSRTLSTARNLVAFQDIGEGQDNNIGVVQSGKISGPAFVLNGTNGSQNLVLPDNGNNQFNPDGIEGGDQSFLTQNVRDNAFVKGSMTLGTISVQEGIDYSVLENARLLNENQYSLNTQLGYISLNQRLNNDEVLAVAYQYTRGGQVFQVGEFANDGVSNTQLGNTNETTGTELSASQNLVVKQLKSSVTDVSQPVWDLMMKNIYALGTFRLEREDFRLNIVYANPSPRNFIESVDPSNRGERISIEDIPGADTSPTLLRLFRLDQLNINNDPVSGGDGFFDFFPGLTVDTENGAIIFPVSEPFGEHLFDVLTPTGNNPGGQANYEDQSTYNENQKEYVYNLLYSTTKIEAEQEQASKNRFKLKGRFKTSGQNGISIGAFNVPRGSVRVTAGGRLLQEGLDYTVNYQLGRVEIIDPALLASNTPIEVSTENNAVFGQQTKRFSGINFETKISEDFVFGGTLLNLRERPFTQKSNLNFEPINNTILGLNANYSTEVPFLTRMVNKLPNIDTEAPSNFSIRGEFAYLFANAPSAADFNGEVTSYVDDFEGVQTRIDISNPLSWELSSVPLGNGVTNLPFNVSNNTETSEQQRQTGYRRGALSWYTIDPIFYNNNRPSGVSVEDVSTPEARRIFINELFENTQIPQNQTRTLFTFDMFYRPDERGPYNYNDDYIDGIEPSEARSNFAGITRAINSTNFEQSNVEFVEFWILNPYVGSTQDANAGNVGEIRFNIGNISEDVLADNKKMYENGLPESAVSPLDEEAVRAQDLDGNGFGVVPRNQSLVYAFDNDGAARTQQDAGFDGLKNAQEKLLEGVAMQYKDENDPAEDDYEYFLRASNTSTIPDRYRKYNGTDGNSITEVSEDNRGNGTTPTVEDVNRDNTHSTLNQYFEYTVKISPSELNIDTANENRGLVKDRNTFSTDNTPDGSSVSGEWVQIQIPVNSDEFREAIGGINDLRSARFIRMYVTGFERPIVLRMGSLDLVRGTYRQYLQPNNTPENMTVIDGSDNIIDTEGLNNDVSDGLGLDVSSVSVEQNPRYTIPPGVIREQVNNNNTLIAQDERSLSLRVSELPAGDTRAVYNNYNIDMRQYENVEMFIHAEQLEGSSGVNTLDDEEVSAIVRFGTDFTENFYQIEIPLKITEFNQSGPNAIWPEVNRFNLPLEVLQKVKAAYIGTDNSGNPRFNREDLVFFDESANAIADPDNVNNLGNLKVGIKGNPSFGNVKVFMLGVKNNESQPKDVELWFNELRLSGLKNQGGWAAVANVDTNIADFASISASGRISTVGFGSIEQGPSERSQEDLKQYDVTTNVQLGQLLPKKWGVQIPVSYSRGEELITPQYDPLNEDLLLEDVLDNAGSERDAIEERSTEYTKRQSVSVIGLRKNRVGEKKPMPYDIENFSFSGTYNQEDHRSFEIEKAQDLGLNLSGTYNYNFVPWEISPFKKTKFTQKGKYWQWLKDLNFNPLPTNISVTSGINRRFNEQLFRDVLLGEGDIKIDPLQQRNYLFNWQYALGFNLTKSLNVNFTSATDRIVRNFLDDNDVVNVNNTIWDGLSDIGDPNTLNQSLQANYNLPFDKFPALSFINSTYSYTGNFQWQKASENFREAEITNTLPDGSEETRIFDLGNTIQNSSIHRLNTSFDLNKFYKEIGFVKRTSNQKKVKKKKKDSLQTGPKIASRTRTNKAKTPNNKLKPGIKAYNTAVAIVSGLKKLSVNYQRDSGTVLPGFTQDVGLLGTLKPSLGFTFGGQSDIRQEAARRGYLTLYDEFNQQYQTRKTEQLDLQGTIEFVKDLKIDITASRTKSTTFAENFRVDDLGNRNFQYNSLTPYESGNFSISTILLKTSFSSSSETNSKTFEEFKENRKIISDRLASQRGVSADADGDGFVDGFGRNNQAVLLPAFLAAYTGKDAGGISLGAFRSFPLPNWSIKYTGFMKKKWFKKRFKRFSLNHGYRSDYTINQFQTNLEYQQNQGGKDASGNFLNETLYGNISLSEQFSPLIKVDLETKSAIKLSGELRRDRALSFSFDNQLLTEVSGNEVILGLGYRIKDIRFKTRFAGRQKIVKSDLNLKADISLRQNETIIRNLDIDNSQITSGQTVYSIRFTTDYALSKNLTALFFYDHTFSRFAISTSFPSATIRSGFTLRYNFGN